MGAETTERESHPDERDLGWSLGVLLGAYQSALGEALGDLPHGFRGYQVLREVARCDQPSQLALAAHLSIDRTVMTYLIDDLATAGLVERHLNETDRRQRRIIATSSGLSLLHTLECRVIEAEEAILESLTTAERHALRSLVQRAACGARGLGADRDPCDVAEEIARR